MKKGILPGVILIFVGTFLLLNQIFDMPDSLPLVFLGIALLVVRFATGKYGFTIAGCIALFLGLSAVVEELRFIPNSLVDCLQLSLLALAFFVIHIIEFRRIGNWPLIPGICLLAVAALVFVEENLYLSWNFWDIIARFWPIGLICLGAAMIGGVYSRKNRQIDEGNQNGNEDHR